MSLIELKYTNMESVPEAFRELYTEKDGEAILTGVSGMKTPQDVLNVQEALRKERENHSIAKEQLKAWTSLGEDPEKVRSQIDRIPELEVAANKLDDEAINKIVESRIAQKVGPLERKLSEALKEKDQLTNLSSTLENQLLSRDRNDVLREVATEMKMIPTAISDLELLAANYLEKDETTGQFIVKADVKDMTPGMDVKGFLKEMQSKRPHWWPQSRGGGAGGNGSGGGSDNPWSKNSWSLTAQSDFVRTHGMAEAEKLAKSAGSQVGAVRPPA